MTPPLIVGITSLPSRVGLMRPTLDSLCAGNLKPDRIIVSLPLRSRREKCGYAIPDFLSEYPSVTVVRPTYDWGPGTKLMGALGSVKDPSVLVAADDDVTYRPEFLQNLYKAQIEDKASSFSHFVYRTHSIDVGQGCDGYSFWTPNLRGIVPFADKFVKDTRLMLQDDLWVSFYLAGQGVPVRSLQHVLGGTHIYEQVHEVNALCNLTGRDQRESLTHEWLLRLALSAPLPLRRRAKVLGLALKHEARLRVRALRQAISH